VSGLLDTGVTVLIFLAILVVLVLVHEVGHFVAARVRGVRVNEFGIGFPPKAVRLWNDGETDYTLNWLPLGGYVRMEGEEGESEDPRAFVRQGLGTRLFILVSGVVMNLALAFVIFTVIAWNFEPVAETRVESVSEGSPAASIGLVAGDVITRVDGRTFPYFENVAPTTYMRDRAGQQVTITVERASGETADVPVTLRGPEDVAAGKGALGIGARFVLGETVQRSPLDAIRIGAQRTVEACGMVLGALRDLVTSIVSNPGQAPPVAGPIGIAQAVGTVRSQAPPVVLLWLIAVLSANLAVVNILPFPPLDGGRVAVALIQAVTRNRINLRLERATYLIGFILLMAFILWVSYFDIIRGGIGA
jgi:regulator of sigma E protease